MINALIWLYRINPVRPHCDAENNVHTFLCSLIMPHLAGGDSCRGYKNVGMCGERPSNSPHWRKVG